jgi:hypothetical protein
VHAPQTGDFIADLNDTATASESELDPRMDDAPPKKKRKGNKKKHTRNPGPAAAIIERRKAREEAETKQALNRLPTRAGPGHRLPGVGLLPDDMVARIDACVESRTLFYKVFREASRGFDADDNLGYSMNDVIVSLLIEGEKRGGEPRKKKTHNSISRNARIRIDDNDDITGVYVYGVSVEEQQKNKKKIQPRPRLRPH